jgi:hypothetical protein
MKTNKNIKNFEQFNENLNISGLKCDNPNCDYIDPTVPFSDYEKSINKPCPECGESLLTQADYDKTLQIVRAMELLSKLSSSDLDNIASNLTEDEIDSGLDMMNQLKFRKEGDNNDGSQTWSLNIGKDIRK